MIPKRFERLTHALEGRCSIQLSYGTILNCAAKVRTFVEPCKKKKEKLQELFEKVLEVFKKVLDECGYLSRPQVVGLVIKFLALLQRFHKLVDTAHLFRDIEALRTFLYTLVASDAMVGLTELGHRTVITDEVIPTKLPVVLVHRADRHTVFVDTLVEM